MLSCGSTATLAPMKPILAVGLMRADHARRLAVGLEAGRRGMDDDQLMRLHVVLDVLEGEIVRRRVDQLASPAPWRRPGPARWGTRSSSLRASSDSARRRRRHSRRRTEPGGTVCASRFDLTVIDQRIVRPHAVAAAAPFDTAAEKARDKNRERHHIAHRQQPERPSRRWKARSSSRWSKRRHASATPTTAHGRRHTAEQHAEQGQRQSICDHQPGKAERIHGPDGARPAQLMAKKLLRGGFGADMRHRLTRDRHRKPGTARRAPIS